MKANEQRYIQTRALAIDDIKVGLIMRANWNGATHEIIGIEDNIVVYDWKADPCKSSNDGYYRDTIEVVLREFKKIVND